MFARFIGTNCRNGPPMKKIWVPKSCLENLPVNVGMTPPGKKTNPRSKASHGPTPMFCREIVLKLKNMNVCLQTTMFIGLRTFLLIHMSIIHLLQGYLLGLQSRNSLMLHLDSLLLRHPWRCGWWRRINSLLQNMVSSQQSKASNTIAGDRKHIKGRMIKWLTTYSTYESLTYHTVC